MPETPAKTERTCNYCNLQSNSALHTIFNYGENDV